MNELKNQIPDTLFSSSKATSTSTPPQYLTPSYQSPLFSKTRPSLKTQTSTTKPSLLTVEMKAADERDSFLQKTSSVAACSTKETSLTHSVNYPHLKHRATNLQGSQSVPIVRKRKTTLQRDEFSMPSSLYVKQPRNNSIQANQTPPKNYLQVSTSPETTAGTPPKITLNLGSAFPNHGNSDMPIYVIPPQSPPRGSPNQTTKKIQNHLAQIHQKKHKKKLKSRTFVLN